MRGGRIHIQRSPFVPVTMVSIEDEFSRSVPLLITENKCGSYMMVTWKLDCWRDIVINHTAYSRHNVTYPVS